MHGMATMPTEIAARISRVRSSSRCEISEPSRSDSRSRSGSVLAIGRLQRPRYRRDGGVVGRTGGWRRVRRQRGDRRVRRQRDDRRGGGGGGGLGGGGERDAHPNGGAGGKS